MTTFTSRLRALAAALSLCASVGGVPAVLLSINAVPTPSEFSWSRLTGPDDGTLVLEVLAAICWIAWAVFTWQIATSVRAQILGRRSRTIPGLAVPQHAADRLVAAALLFAVVPTTTPFLPQPAAEATAAIAPLPVSSKGPPEATPPRAPEAKEEPEIERYTVKRGDSLWRIADERLGDGARYVELVELNRAVLNGRPDFLLPGAVLRVPVPGGAPAGAYVVQPGDTLSEIAEAELGDADAYPSIFKASRGTVQAAGARMSDPNLILPGWRLTMPSRDESPGSPGHLNHVPPPAVSPEATPPPPESAPSEGPESAADPEAANNDAGDTGERLWLLPGLAGAGSMLGGALWMTLRARRRTQLRYRRPGTIIPPPPAELLSAEKTASATASVVAPRIEALDAALRSLPSYLDLVTAAISDGEISLTLHEAAELPAPWSGDASNWRIALADVPDRPQDSFPPYPLLVSVGQAIDGSFLFLNLEALRIVTVTGDPGRKAAFARHLAAELAVNPWSIVTTVDVLGLGPELASFNLGRVRAHPAGDTGFIADMARALSTLTGLHEPEDFQVALIASAARPSHDVEPLAKVIERIPGRACAALVDLAGEPRSSGAHLQLTSDGRLRAAALGVDVMAAGLTVDEARACALLLDLTLEQTVIPVPQPDDAKAVSDLAGALSEQLTAPRPDGPAGDSSLLPLDVRVYADAAATTVEDIQELAPLATSEARAAVEAKDSGLDVDLARWESPTLASSKLTLLGPVGARTTGDTKATAHRRPFYVELLAFLALHPDGVSGPAVAEAFGLRPDRVRVDMSQLRRWLGTDPRNGKPYLPRAEPARASESPALYRLDGVLCDLHLFRRLRSRGQSRGADGIDDLIAALRLVSGEPFTELRRGHWDWLLEGDRWDHIITSAIVDVGHIVSTHALALGNHSLALWAAQAAYSAAPYDEVAQLDMVQAERAIGETEAADRHLNDRVFNRRDEDLPPIDLPQRTAGLAGKKDWGKNRRRPRQTG